MLQKIAPASIYTRRMKELVEPALHPHDQALLLARMARFQWRVGTPQLVFNDSVYTLLGLDRSFVPSIKNLRQFISTRDLGRMLATINKVLLDVQTGIVDLHIQHPNDKDHAGYQIRCYCVPETDDDGNVVSLEGLLQDVTTEKQDRTALRYAMDETEAANRAKSRFLATMSHELRTPLNAIIGFSEVMQTELLGPLGNSRYTSYAADINQSGRFLLDLINDVLDMSKIEAGKYELVREPINIGKLLRHACHMMEATAQERNVALLVQDGQNDGKQTDTVKADRRALLQIVLNLLSNAVKFTPPGGHVAMTVDTDRAQKTVSIAITDTGVGIPSDKLQRVGEPFEQFGDVHTRNQDSDLGGTGLGLAITKKLVQLHGGQFDIASELGSGTTVTITLPL